MSKIAALAPLDKFGVTPSINWKGQSKTHSLCGIFATLAILGLVIALAVIYSSDMVHKTNPTQTQSILYGGLGRETRTLTSDVFKVSFGLQDASTLVYYQDPSVYTVVAALVTSDETNSLCQNSPSHGTLLI